MKDYSLELHRLFNSLTRYNHTFDPNTIPRNGIYIFFEKGEKFGELNRIVRAGTHNADNRLPIRLGNHLCKEKKESSIFRKNIGRAILNQRGDGYLAEWNQRSGSTDDLRQAQVESEVTAYMRKNLTFVVIPVDTEEERLELERAIIATIDSCCPPSDSWLGNHSPINKIRQSGLWLVQGIGSEHITEAQYNRLCELLDR